jgi:hypothetical protein
MSESLPAVRDVELDRLARLGQWLAASEADDKTANGRGAAAALRFAYAEALGLPLMAAAELSVIRGRLVLSAKLLRALAYRNGFRIRRDPKSDATSCTAILETELGAPVGTCTFTMEQAKKAGLVRPGSSWETWPERMLWARASKRVLDDFAPHVTLGIWEADEAAEITGDAEHADWSPVDENTEEGDGSEVPWPEDSKLDELAEAER